MSPARRTLSLVALIAVAGASRLPAFFDGARSGLLAADAAGRGGAEVAADSALGAVADNPAGLPEQGDWHAGLLGASGAGAQAQWGVALSAIPAAGLRWGLLYRSAQDRRLAPLTEQSVAGALALDLGGGRSLGLRLNGHQLQGAPEGQSLSGGSLDLGFRWQLAPLAWLHGAWSLGLAADNAASAWSDEDQGRAVPSQLRAGLQWRPWPSLTLAGEGLWTVEAALPDSTRRDWRAGADWSPWRPTWTLRAGWRSELGGQASAGLGFPLAWGAHGDYAALLQPGGGAGLAHRLSLTWDLVRSEDRLIQVRPALVLTDPESGEIQRASFEVSLDPRLQAQSWTLELGDGAGALRRRLGPSSELEASLEWDGLDEAGKPVAQGQRVYYSLVAQTPKGVVRKTSSLALSQAWSRASFDQGGGSGGLDAPRLKPVFAVDGSALQQVVMELPDADADGWHVELRDHSGKTLRKFSGLGKLPKELVWDGRDQDGFKVQDPLGVSVDFQIRTEDGAVRSAVQPLFSQKAYEIAQRESKQRPSLSLAPLGFDLSSAVAPPPASEGSLAPLFGSAERSQGALAKDLRARELAVLRREHVTREADGALSLDLFDPGAEEPRADRGQLLGDLAAGPANSTLLIQGLAREGEPDPQRLARQRAMAVATRLSGQAVQGMDIILTDGPQAAERSGVRGRSLPAVLGAAGQGRTAAQLAQARPEQLNARYTMAEEGERGPDALPDQPLSPAQALAIRQRWGLDDRRPVMTQWCPRTDKVAFFKDGWLWVTDRQGSAMRSLWYEPDLNAAGRLRWSKDGRVLWLRADGWRRWVSLELSAEPAF